MTEYNTVVVNLLAALDRNLDKSIHEKVHFAGDNTGNLLFVDSMKKQLDYAKEIWINPVALKDVEHPAVVIPASNFIIEGGESLLEKMEIFLDNTDCPVTMAGLGAQAQNGESPKELVAKLSETKKRVFKKLSERAVTIGVRGEYSAQCMEEMGIHNVRVIGCPSYYFRDKKSYRVKIPSMRNTQMTVTPGNAKETGILETGYKLDSHWMMQMTSELPEVAFEHTELTAEWAKQIAKTFPRCDIYPEDIWAYMRARAHIFFTKEEWDAFYDKEDISFAFGSRFHGNMAAFQNGIPALWIVHDQRTEELTNTLYLPSIDYRTFENLRYEEELLEYCDYREYEKHYGELYDKYLAFLKENNLKYH